VAAIFVAKHAQGFIFLQKYIVFCWNYVFNAEVSPLRHIVDSSMRHYVLQALGFMWAVASLLAAGSYTLIPASIIGHVVLISPAFLTVATYTTASLKPSVFSHNNGRGRTGEHE
jgi:hypothetical protein